MRACCDAHDARPDASTTAADALEFVVVLRARACQGQGVDWLPSAAPLLLSEAQVDDYLPLVAWLDPPCSAVADDVSARPDVPPPERTQPILPSLS
jgi:hypothetical protein